MNAAPGWWKEKAEVPGPGHLPVEPLHTGRGGDSRAQRSTGGRELLGRNLPGPGEKLKACIVVCLFFFFPTLVCCFIFISKAGVHLEWGRASFTSFLPLSQRLRGAWIAGVEMRNLLGRLPPDWQCVLGTESPQLQRNARLARVNEGSWGGTFPLLGQQKVATLGWGIAAQW